MRDDSEVYVKKRAKDRIRLSPPPLSSAFHSVPSSLPQTFPLISLSPSFNSLFVIESLAVVTGDPERIERPMPDVRSRRPVDACSECPVYAVAMCPDSRSCLLMIVLGQRPF
jgi:hypothetical protein